MLLKHLSQKPEGREFMNPWQEVKSPGTHSRRGRLYPPPPHTRIFHIFFIGSPCPHVKNPVLPNPHHLISIYVPGWRTPLQVTDGGLPSLAPVDAHGLPPHAPVNARELPPIAPVYARWLSPLAPVYVYIDEVTYYINESLLLGHIVALHLVHASGSSPFLAVWLQKKSYSLCCTYFQITSAINRSLSTVLSVPKITEKLYNLNSILKLMQYRLAVNFGTLRSQDFVHICTLSLVRINRDK